MIDNQRYLEESGCASVCINSCKVPTQEFFARDMGIPLSMEPDYDTFECKYGPAPSSAVCQWMSYAMGHAHRKVEKTCFIELSTSVSAAKAVIADCLLCLVFGGSTPCTKAKHKP